MTGIPTIGGRERQPPARFWYLASPYSKHPAGVDAAHAEACAIAAGLFRSGVQVFSPIAHTHAIAQTGGLGLGFDQWAAFDEAMIAASVGMIVAKMEGWRDSAGIAAEIAICKRLGKPVQYLDPGEGPGPIVGAALDLLARYEGEA